MRRHVSESGWPPREDVKSFEYPPLLFFFFLFRLKKIGRERDAWLDQSQDLINQNGEGLIRINGYCLINLRKQEGMGSDWGGGGLSPPVMRSLMLTCLDSSFWLLFYLNGFEFPCPLLGHLQQTRAQPKSSHCAFTIRRQQV